MKSKPSAVHCDPEILGGIPVFVGTRVPLQNLIDCLKAGHTLSEFLDDFPSVSRDQALAALEEAQAALLRDAERRNLELPETDSIKELARFWDSHEATETLEPRARTVTLDEEALKVDLVDGRTLIIPLTWFPCLWHGTPAERENLEISGDGAFLHWPDLDEDLSVAGLLSGQAGGESPESLKKWLERRAFQHLESDPRFLARIDAARQSLREGRGVRLERVPEEEESRRSLSSLQQIQDTLIKSGTDPDIGTLSQAAPRVACGESSAGDQRPE
jgi:uncharacterized protein (DUF433 family)